MEWRVHNIALGVIQFMMVNEMKCIFSWPLVTVSMDKLPIVISLSLHWNLTSELGLGSGWATI